jgi:IS1 family transposase
VPSWFIGNRDVEAARLFIYDLAPRLANRVQLTSDGHRAYVVAVREGFRGDVDYAQLVKLYGPSLEGQRRYSPPACVGARKKPRVGDPKREHISTSYAERNNLTMRMQMRRFTRLTNAFSKKLENHACAVALHFMHYNFVRIHQTLRMTPAMAAKVTDRLWEIGDIVKVLEDWEGDHPALPARQARHHVGQPA